ncbi:MAG: response regulator transcription factor [Chitinophagaceae bacterium]|nr:MAG: response regulator transcription factor [Chitinophagaceae bacterium]
MPMIKCLVIDDEPSAIESLTRHILRCPILELVGASTDGIRGLELVNLMKPNLVFLDIELQEVNGLDLTRWIGNAARVIFCTAHAGYAVTGYELDVVDYLLKPVEYDRFSEAIVRANTILARDRQMLDRETSDFLFVKAGTRGKRIRVDLADLIFIEAKNNYVSFQTGSGKVLAHLSLKEVEHRLPAENFMRVQKSYIVAISQVASMENNELVLKKSGIRIPISGIYKEQFLERMKARVV